MLLLTVAFLLQDDARETVKKALENVRGPRIVADIRLEREGKEEDRFTCERWDTAQKAGVWSKSYFKGSRAGGNAIEWYEMHDALKEPRRSIYLKKGDAWEKQKQGFGAPGLRPEERHAAFDEFRAVRSRMPDLAKFKMDTLEAGDEIWEKVRVEKKEGKLQVRFPQVDARIGEMIELFYEEDDEAHDFIIDRSKLSVVLEIEAASGKLIGGTCVTHYVSRDGKKNFTIRYASQFLELDPKLKLPE